MCSNNAEDITPTDWGSGNTQVIWRGLCYGGILNIGYNPTFGEERLVAETHIFDFDEDIYGQPIKVNLLKFLRGERKFAGPGELSAQICKDVAVAKDMLSKGRKSIAFFDEESCRG